MTGLPIHVPPSNRTYHHRRESQQLYKLLIQIRTAPAVHQCHGSIMRNCTWYLYRSKQHGMSAGTSKLTLLERPAGKDGNKKTKMPTAATTEIGRFRHFKTPCRPHESSGRTSGKPSPAPSRQADTLVEKASKLVHLVSTKVSSSTHNYVSQNTKWRTIYCSQQLLVVPSSEKSAVHVLEQISGVVELLMV